MALRGPRSSSLNPFIRLDGGDRITSPLPCHQCGYLLVGQDIWAQCPECGASIRESLRQNLPRFAPTHRLDTIAHASLLLTIGWAMALALGLGIALVAPASLFFIIGLRKLSMGSRILELALSALWATAGAAAVVALFYFWEWRNSYSFWFGYARISDGYYLAWAVLWGAGVLGSALPLLAATRLAKVCRWPKVRRAAWAVGLLTMGVGLIPVIGHLHIIYPYFGVFEIWWEAWDDALGSPQWWAAGLITAAQFVGWWLIHRALRRLISQRLQDALPDS